MALIWLDENFRPPLLTAAARRTRLRCTCPDTLPRRGKQTAPISPQIIPSQCGGTAMTCRRTRILAPLLAAGVALSSAGQQSNTAAPVKGMASTVGLYVYPEKQQAATQQLTDEQQCYGDAKTRSGYDPDATTTAPKTQDQKAGNDH